MSKILNKEVDESSSVLKELYTDVAHPVLKPAGEILSMLLAETK